MTGLALLVTQTGPTIQLGGKGTSTSVQLLLLLTLMTVLPGAAAHDDRASRGS